MQQRLEMARDNLSRAMARAESYARENRTYREFEVGDWVCLLVPPKSKVLRTGRSARISPRFCGPWLIIKKVSGVAYKLQLPVGCKVHPVFHVSKLKRCLHDGDNLVEGLVSLEEKDTTDYGPDRVLDRRERRLRNRLLREYLVAWKGHPLSDATWETQQRLQKSYPGFVIEDR
ncbi:hypothetical protein O6H91_14G026200 [Diphasiastrum complanatum]|uniref:Uncharacterized protein n=1 Tax=Diphasiastrum complanatum TaxID=34168 RepID=A0ACC2BMH3_DIPCM|nr:hypothetical protein O6H91_14G026200 [Diphasiastrum complanatum]